MVKQLAQNQNNFNNFKRNLFNDYLRSTKMSRKLDNQFDASFNYNEFINAELMILNPYNTNKSYNLAKQNKLSSVNLTICENELRNYYNILSSIKLIYKKLDFTIDFNQFIKFEDSSRSPGVSVSFSVYNTLTGEKLSLRPCNKIQVTMPVNKIIDFSIEPYKYLLKNLTVNLFDFNDPFYNDKCFAYNYKNLSIPINTRRTLFYPNKTASCGDSCNFLNTDSYGDINCECRNPVLGISENLRQVFTNNLLNKLDFTNIGILKCDVKYYLYP